MRVLKKLDLLIIRAFIGPFVATFFITLFVLVLQFFWLYIDDIVGKGVDMLTVARLILYVSATLVPLALPLAVLLSSIMTFGNLGETFELIAIKSAGIPLLRFMRPLFIISLGICYVAFLFNNYIIPIANLKMNTLKYDIIVSKPAFDIKEGVFYDKIEGYVIKIGKKEKDDSTIRNIVIYEQNSSGQQDNVIVADSGKMVVTPDKHSLVFILQNGTTYQEGRGERMSTTTEFIRMGFKEYKKVLDLSSFKLNRTDDSSFRNNYQMFTMKQLSASIDSLKRLEDIYKARSATGFNIGLQFPKYLDTTGWDTVERAPTVKSKFLLVVAKPYIPPSPVTSAKPADTPAASVKPAARSASAKPVPDTTRSNRNLAKLNTLKADTSKHNKTFSKLNTSNTDTAKAKRNLAKLNAIKTDTFKHHRDTAKLNRALARLKADTLKHNRDLQAAIAKAQAQRAVQPPPANTSATQGPPVNANAVQSPVTKITPTQPPAAKTAVTPDSSAKAVAKTTPAVESSAKASVKQSPPRPPVFADYLPDSTRTMVLDRTIGEISSIKASLDQPFYLLDSEQNDLRVHRIAWHEKLTLSVACLVMFLIGAPLGSIIRKGGIGLPLIFAVIFFVVFFLLNNFGKKFVKEDLLSPFAGMWMATYVLTPIGLFLVYKALHDSQLFNKEYYFRAIRTIKKFLKRRNRTVTA